MTLSPHKSGKPIRKSEVKRGYSIERYPREFYLTPRLNNPEKKPYVGFMGDMISTTVVDEDDS